MTRATKKKVTKGDVVEVFSRYNTRFGIALRHVATRDPNGENILIWEILIGTRKLFCEQVSDKSMAPTLTEVVL